MMATKGKNVSDLTLVGLLRRYANNTFDTFGREILGKFL